MCICRVILTALLAFSVVLLPFPGAFAHGPSGSPSLHAADCCNPGTPCEKEAPACPSPASCALKCFSLSGAILPGADIGVATAEAKGPIASDIALHAQPIAPPLPPPRL